MAKKKTWDGKLKNYYQIRNQQPRIHTRTKFSSKQNIFKFWDQIGPKKALRVKISKNYYQIRNQHPRIHTRAEFHLKQSIFKFWGQIGPKKSIFGTKLRQAKDFFCLFLVVTLYSIDVWVIVAHSDS